MDKVLLTDAIGFQSIKQKKIEILTKQVNFMRVSSSRLRRVTYFAFSVLKTI